jgi:histidinol-phosphate aminotransferase
MTFERPNIEVMKGYMPGEQPLGDDIVKLNTNENPYPPGPKVAHCLRQIGVDSLRRYPPPLANDFRIAAAQRHQVAPENIIPTNGGDEFLRLVMTTFVGAGETIAVTKPSYSLYPVLAEIQDSKLVEIALEDDWSMPKNFAQRLNELNAKLAIIVNPHAPSGSLLDCYYLAEIARQFNGVLLIDEAYVDFIEPELDYDSIVLINQYPNILFLRSMSKGYSLAGLRFGYGIGPEQLISPMMYKTRDSYNTDFIAQKLATAAILDAAYAEDTWNKVRASRKTLAISLNRLGISSSPSQANFLLCDIPEVPGALTLYKSLKAKNILVRYFDQDRLRDKLRISIGNEVENQRLVSAIEHALR